MRKILLIPGPYGFSHTTRLWEIGKLFAEKGLEIAVCLNSQQKGISWDFAKTFTSPEFPEMQNSKVNIYEMAGVEIIEGYVQSELKAIDQFVPDVIIADLRPTARISSKLKNIPLITIENAALSKYFEPYAFFGLKVPKVFQNYFRSRTSKKIAEIFRKVAKKYGLKGLDNIFDFINGDQNWICDLPSLFPISDPTKSTFYIGPVIFENPNLNSFVIPKRFISDQNILIYISLGNSRSFELIPVFVKAFEGKQNIDLIITTGLFQKGPMEGLVRSNILVTPYISGSDILPFADIMVHHGGSGSMYQALKYKVPTIILPINIEQKINALAIEKSETGVVLDIEKLTANHLYEKAKQVYIHRNLLKSNSENLSKEVIEALDKSLCLDLIDQLIKN